MSTSPICLDANVIIKVVVEERNVALQQQWRSWREAGQQFVAPVLQRYEITNGLHRYQMTGQLSVAFVDRALAISYRLPITFHDPVADHQRAMELARQFNRPAAYDAHYLALAERLNIEFWTADRRLVNAVQHALGWVRLIGDSTSASA